MAPKARLPVPQKTQKIQVKSRQKPAANKQISQAEKLKRLFRSLCAQIDGGHFKNALKTCDKILRVDPKDFDALQSKLFLLLQTEQYNTALTLLESLDDPASRDFERAYALYRLHRETEAADVLSHLKGAQQASGVQDQDRGVMHLEAQLAYRQCAYQDAFDHYTRLLDSSADSEERADLTTNLNAAQKHLDFLTTGYLHALDALPASVINSLETAAPPAPPGGAAIPSAAVSPVSVSGSVTRPVEKKVRMSRVPKGVTPGVTPPPDPERWIKKSERSTFGQGAGRRRKTGGGATQGSVAEPPSGHNAKAGGGKNRKKK
ncbi:hypothetical protein DFH11DRAFT_771088 [Phellopilus nigrolimitatus]|nr:hypothetical protein DFH11DRAFT_771088 [Phellopilus nigrolimitatus]